MRAKVERSGTRPAPARRAATVQASLPRRCRRQGLQAGRSSSRSRREDVRRASLAHLAAPERAGYAPDGRFAPPNAVPCSLGWGMAPGVVPAEIWSVRAAAIALSLIG